jgi:hypothetical protein
VARDWILTRVLERCIDEHIDIPYPHMQLKYDPASVVEKEAEKNAAEGEKKSAEKERIKAEARIKEEADSTARMNARKEMRARIEELNIALEAEEAKESEEPEDPDDPEGGISQKRLDMLAELQELEHKLDEGSGDDD